MIIVFILIIKTGSTIFKNCKKSYLKESLEKVIAIKITKRKYKYEQSFSNDVKNGALGKQKVVYYIEIKIPSILLT